MFNEQEFYDHHQTNHPDPGLVHRFQCTHRAGQLCYQMIKVFSLIFFPKTLVLTIGENELKEDSSIPEYYKSFIESASNKRYREIKLITETFPSFGHMDTAIPTFIKALKMLK